MNTESRRKTLARQAWMREFESIVTAALPAISGKIAWDSPTHMFNQGMTAADAAARFIVHPESPMPRPVNPQVRKESDHD